MTVREPIAERVFIRHGSGRSVHLLIGKPVPHPEADWICPWQIKGIGDEEVVEASGIDAVQALSVALAMATVRLEAIQLTERLTFLGDEQLFP
jgi:hypothetical protein